MPGGGLQPHRKGSPLRVPGPQLSAMLRGRDLNGQNPADIQRGLSTLVRAARSTRPQRPPRPARPQRPAR